MARPKQAITLDLARKVEAEIKSIAEHKVCFRLQAIISSAHHPVDIVATVMGVHRSTVFNWIKRFREYGVNGLTTYKPVFTTFPIQARRLLTVPLVHLPLV